MNTSEAKERLFLYRGPIDNGDPQFEEALAHAQRDPEVAEWMREQSSCYDTIRSKLREIEPPSDLAEKIIRRRPISLRRGWAQIRDIFTMRAPPRVVAGCSRDSYLDGHNRALAEFLAARKASVRAGARGRRQASTRAGARNRRQGRSA